MLMKQCWRKGVASAKRSQSRLLPDEVRFVEHDSQSAQVLPNDEGHPKPVGRFTRTSSCKRTGLAELQVQNINLNRYQTIFVPLSERFSVDYPLTPSRVGNHDAMESYIRSIRSIAFLSSTSMVGSKRRACSIRSITKEQSAQLIARRGFQIEIAIIVCDSQPTNRSQVRPIEFNHPVDQFLSARDAV